METKAHSTNNLTLFTQPPTFFGVWGLNFDRGTSPGDGGVRELFDKA